MINWRKFYWRFTNAVMNLGPEPQRLDWRVFVLSALMAPLAPLSADCLQSLAVVRRDMDLYRELLWGCFEAPINFCLFVGLRTIVTLLFLWLANIIGFRGRIVWICFLVIWAVLDFAMETSMRK